VRIPMRRLVGMRKLLFPASLFSGGCIKAEFCKIGVCELA
jgi:hypothetical protein